MTTIFVQPVIFILAKALVEALRMTKIYPALAEIAPLFVFCAQNVSDRTFYAIF